MALLTSLARVKALALGDSFIQGLTGADAVVSQVFGYVTNHVTDDPWGIHQQEAQDYLAAHLLSSAGQANGGQGPTSTETIGRITTGFTLPYLNRKEQMGMTQYGTRFLDLRDSVTLSVFMIVPGG